MMKEYKEVLPVSISVCNIVTQRIHWHRELELIFVLKGSLQITIAFDQYELSAGDVVVINGNDVHDIRGGSTENLVLRASIDLSSLERDFPNLENILFFCEPSMDMEHKEYALGQVRYYLAQLFVKINSAVPDTREGQKLLYRLLYELVKNFQSFHITEDKFEENGQQAERFYKIIDYIYKNYKRKISIDDLAEELHLSKYYLSHFIKDATGMTLHEYINYARIDYATKLLLSGSMNITEISFACGFSDCKYFIKNFKKWFRTTPSEYRERYANQGEDRIEACQNMREVTRLLRPYLGPTPPIKTEPEIKFQIYELDLNARGTPYLQNWKHKICLRLNDGILERKTLIRRTCAAFDLEHLTVTDCFSEDGWDEISSYQVYKSLDFLSHLNLALTLQANDETQLARMENYLNDAPDEWDFKLRQGKLYTNRDWRNDTLIATSKILHDLFRDQCEPIRLFDDQKDAKDGEIFHGGNGLITINGLRKPAFYLFYLLSLLGEEVIVKKQDRIVTRKDEDFQILVHNDGTLEEGGRNKTAEIEFRLQNQGSDYKVSKYHIHTKGCIRGHWSNMGSPKYLSCREERLLNHLAFPSVDFDFIKKGKAVSLGAVLEPFETSLILLEKV